jgi:tetratricopeptide (TPR) repeat protein
MSSSVLAQVRQLIYEGSSYDPNVAQRWLTELADQENTEPDASARDLAAASSSDCSVAGRHLALGWLHWLGGDFAQAEAALTRSVEAAQVPDPTEAGYWSARAKLCSLWTSSPAAEDKQCPEIVPSFAKTLRARSASPQATLRFIDLLWRGGQPDRAEQIWQTVRQNRKVRGTALAGLIEARVSLRHGDAAVALQVLRELTAVGGVWRVEKLLLLAWALDAIGRFDEAATILERLDGPYPAILLERWRRTFHERHQRRRSSADCSDPASAEPPAGVLRADWFLHMASRCLRRDEYRLARAWIAHSGAQESDAVLQTALPDLDRLAQAETIADVFRVHPEQKPWPPGLIVDIVKYLPPLEKNVESSRRQLAELVEAPALTAELAHHLGIVLHRNAMALEDVEVIQGVGVLHGGTDVSSRWSAADCRRLSWRCWLCWLASLPAAEVVAEGRAGVLLDYLMTGERERMQAWLIAAHIERARKLWKLIHELPSWVPAGPLSEYLKNAVVQFRENLTAAYLTATHELMRGGDIPPGWRADHEKGLSALRRLLSLDPENLRLLTTLIDRCGDYFFDCYNNEAWDKLGDGLNSCTPLALKLVRMIESRPADVAARAALAEFYKFRGLAALDRAGKIALWREALHFNPGNHNVRELLAQVGAEGGMP